MHYLSSQCSVLLLCAHCILRSLCPLKPEGSICFYFPTFSIMSVSSSTSPLSTLFSTLFIHSVDFYFSTFSIPHSSSKSSSSSTSSLSSLSSLFTLSCPSNSCPLIALSVLQDKVDWDTDLTVGLKIKVPVRDRRRTSRQAEDIRSKFILNA